MDYWACAPSDHQALRALLFLLLAFPSSSRAQNPTLSDDLTSIMEWLTYQTAQGLGFNAGSTFDPPNEMKPWRMQPDVSLGLGILPYNKDTFPTIQVEALEEQNPSDMLPDKVLFPNLTVHVRMGLPGRMDVGGRFANMSTPKNYRLSKTTRGNGQSNSFGFGVRKHFFGRGRPLLSIAGAYNHTFGSFNFVNRSEDLELVPNFTASSTNSGVLDWDVRSLGINIIVSQAYGKWMPFFGAGYNRMSGTVHGKIEARWESALPPSLGKAVSRPEPNQARLILGFQRDGSFFDFFINGELKALGPQAWKSYIISTGWVAPFRLGAESTLVRYGRNRPKNYAERKRRSILPWRNKTQTVKHRKKKRMSHEQSRIKRYWLWGDDRTYSKEQGSSPLQRRGEDESVELIFLQ